jgi:LPS-assembly protein
MRKSRQFPYNRGLFFDKNQLRRDMPQFRNSLLSHLSPSLLTKMSLAVLAAFSTSAFGADNPAASSTVLTIVSNTKAVNSIYVLDAALVDPVTPEMLMLSTYSYTITQNAISAMDKAISALPTESEARSYVSESVAIASTSQLIAAADMNAGTDINGIVAAVAATTASNAANQVSRAFDDIPIGVKSPSNKDETTIRAEQMTGRPQRVLNFDGQVEIVRGPSTIDSETAEYHGVEDLVMANRNVQIFRERDCYSGDTMEMQMDTGEGFLMNPTYQLAKNNASGFAKRMNFVDDDRSQIEDGMYTTCQGTKPDWYMLSSRLDLDTGRDEGVAYDGVVYFKDVPILAAPWMSFPISDARRSGVLPPEFYSTTTGGPEITVPYYFNIAPNRDFTLYPTYIEKRGEQLGGELRYLDPDYNGITHAEITPSDEDDNGMTRYSISTIHNETLMPGLKMALNYNRASDDNYAIDYSHSITQSSQHLLPQTLVLTYSTSPIWSIGMAVVNYQVLQDANDDITKPYEILPRLSGTVAKINDHGFDWSSYTEYTNFLSSNADTLYGERLTEQAQISYPITGTYYFITPKLLYHYSGYKLVPNNDEYTSNFSLLPGGGFNVSTAEFQNSATLSVPTFSLDSGLYFERETSLLGRDITQTLEPRLFYVNTPYRDQRDVPLFDTGISDINFAQIFNENRFSGQDRVGDANQLTAALITRAIEMDGQERMRFALAQRVSFEQPKVVDVPYFYATNFSGLATSTTPISTLPSRSDLIFAANGKLSDTLSVEAGWQYSESFQNTQQMNYGFKWQPGPMQVLNAEYRFQQISEVDPEGMKQVDVSLQWPVAPRWYAVARSNFSIQDHRVLDGLAGFEYKQDCWVFRFVAQRYLVPSTVANVTSSATTSLFFQLELNGLSKIGSNPLEVLRRSISGYQPINQPNTQNYQQSNF